MLPFGDYLEGALYSPGGTDHFAHRAPLAAPRTLSMLFFLDLPANQRQILAVTHLHAEPTTVAFT